MDFQIPYVMAMREQAPKMFMALTRAGELQEHAREKSVEAHRLLEELLADEREAEEIVRGMLIEFPESQKNQSDRSRNRSH